MGSVIMRRKINLDPHHLRIAAAVMICTLCLLGSGGTAVLAGGLAGSVTDAATGVSLAGIDLDLFDSNFSAVTTVNPITGSDGIYQISPLPAGDYYLRVDPTAAQGYVDSYYPGVFLKSQATLITVAEFGTTIASFSLQTGTTISGTITDAATGLPIGGMDLDVFASDQSFIGSINARTDSTGAYTLGAFPAGCFFVQADPETTFYLPEFTSGGMFISTATSICVDGVTPMTTADIAMDLGGKISGILTDTISGAPVDSVDIDVFDALGAFQSYADGRSLPDGSYVVGALPPGQYFVQADPVILQGYPDTYYGDSYSMSLAVPVSITAGATTTGCDIHLMPGGSFSGTVTEAATGLPVAGLRVSLFDSSGSIISGAGANTAADGSFLVGIVPPGNYFVRAKGDSASGLAFEFYPGVALVSNATPVAAVAGSDIPGIDFTLDQGGWITGMAKDQASGLPIELCDLDVYSTQQEFIGALDAGTATDGTYVLGPVPVGDYLVKCSPPVGSPLQVQYYLLAADAQSATAISVLPPNTVPGIDFVLNSGGATPVPVPGSRTGVHLLGTYPNPFNPRTNVVFELPARQEVQLAVHDVRGRFVVSLYQGVAEAGRHEQAWNGRDAAGKNMPSGVYFVRLTGSFGQDITKLILVK